MCLLFIQGCESNSYTVKKKLPELHLNGNDLLSNVFTLNDENCYLHTA